jgi:hypothetical protein
MGKSKKGQVSIIPEITQELSTEALKEQIVKGIWFLEACLFSQAGFEFSRIGKTRDTISKLENNLLDWKEVDKLSAQDKMYLYKLLTNNMTNSLDFLQKLHNSLSETMESISSFEKLKRDSIHEEVRNQEDRVVIGELRVMLLEKIKEKTRQKQIGGLSHEKN